MDPPDYYYPGDAPARNAPVWPWYLTYAILMAVVYLGTSALGIFMLFQPGLLSTKSSDETIMLIYGVVLTVVSVPLTIAFAAAPFLPHKPWAWLVHLALIALGMTSACCLPACLPLLLFWLKPETKAMFGRT